MKHFFISLLLSLSMCAATAQEKHFIYLQTETLSPFYVRMGTQIISSTAGGYVIIPKLNDTLFNFQLGLAGSAEVQDYVVEIKGNDKGFIVKNFGDKGWGLEDIVTHDLQWSHELSSKQEAIRAGVKQPSPVQPKPVELKEQTVTGTITQSQTETNTAQKPAPAKEVVVAKETAADSVRFLDEVKISRTDSAEVKTAMAERQPVVNSTEQTDPAATNSLADREPCVALLTREEHDNLIKAAVEYEASPNAYLKNLERIFKQKCVNTIQVAALLSAMPNDTERLKIVKLAWPHTLDYFNFKNLNASMATEEGRIGFDKLVK